MKIALIQPREVMDWERGELARIRTQVNTNSHRNEFTLTPTPNEADLIVLLESCSFKTWHDIREYEALASLPSRASVCCINYEDVPPGFLPGLYSSLEATRFDPAMHVSWPHLRLPNEKAECAPPAPLAAEPSLLFTFSGSCSHPLRRRLFNRFSGSPTKEHKVVEVRKWYNHDEAEKTAFVADIVNSRFVLCPRGIASYSHRIIETMALGRVPVIIADHWVPFGIPENEYYLRIPERDVAHVDVILREQADRYPQLHRNVIAVYAKYFARETRYSVALNRLAVLFRDKLVDHDLGLLRARWHSRAFWKSNGWCLEDRLVRRVRKLIA